MRMRIRRDEMCCRAALRTLTRSNQVLYTCSLFTKAEFLLLLSACFLVFQNTLAKGTYGLRYMTNITHPAPKTYTTLAAVADAARSCPALIDEIELPGNKPCHENAVSDRP